VGSGLAGGVEICVAVAIAVEGDRIVSLAVWDTAANRAERRVWHELASWREQLRSIENLGAFRTTTSSLIAPGVPLATVQVAAIGAAGFIVRRVRLCWAATWLKTTNGTVRRRWR
jgi:hypothetical protein